MYSNNTVSQSAADYDTLQAFFLLKACGHARSMFDSAVEPSYAECLGLWTESNHWLYSNIMAALAQMYWPKNNRWLPSELFLCNTRSWSLVSH